MLQKAFVEPTLAASIVGVLERLAEQQKQTLADTSVPIQRLASHRVRFADDRARFGCLLDVRPFERELMRIERDAEAANSRLENSQAQMSKYIQWVAAKLVVP